MASFDADVKKHMVELQKQVKTILKNLKRPDLDYNIQISLDCMHPSAPTYSVWIQPPAERINRLSWLGKSFDDLMQQLKDFEKTDEYDVEIAYHGASIEACKETIKHHEDEIEFLNKLKQEKEQYDGDGSDGSH